MRNMTLAIILLAFIRLSFAGQTATSLFVDNYNRSIAQMNDIDLNSTGMSGTLAPLEYVERGDDQILETRQGLTNIENNQLHLADGDNATTMYLNHNFTDAAIAMAGSLRFGLTIVSNDGTFTDIDRWCGFGVGNTLTECENSALDFNGIGFRGRLSAAQIEGTSDMWIGWSPVNGGSIEVVKNGPSILGGEDYLIPNIALAGNDRLELELFFNDFNAGSEVKAYILWNSVIVGVDTFVWDNTNANYLGICCRQGGAGFTVDDLAIDTIYNDRAQNPVPADKAINLPTGNITLEWDKGQGISVTGHKLYVTTGLDAQGDPNFTGSDVLVDGQSITDLVDPATYGLSLGYDQTIYWRVDEVTSSQTITGEIWSFESVKSVPIILESPIGTEAFPDDPDVTFTVLVESLTPAHFQWYHSVDNASDTTADDTPVGSDSSSLSVSPTVANEGYYYCVVSNDSGSDVPSDPAWLVVKRLMLYWDMETTAITDMSNNGNDAIDETVKADPADPNVSFPTLSTDVPGAIGSHSAVFVRQTNGDHNRLTAPLDLNLDGDPLTVEPTLFPIGFTVSLWVKTSEINQNEYSGIFNNEGGNNDFQIDMSGDGFYRYHVLDASEWMIGPAPENEWVYIAVVCDGTTTTMYYNLVGNDKITIDFAHNLFGQFRVGCNRNTTNPFTGQIDDVKVWNYPVSYAELADDYYTVTGKPVCESTPALDMNGDCVINIADIAAMANVWLTCNLYPESECKY